MGLVGLGYNHQAGCVLIETVDNARPLHPANAGQTRTTVGDERVDECPRRVTRGRVHNEALRLVDDDDRVVLVNDIEWDGLALRRSRFGRG